MIAASDVNDKDNALSSEYRTMVGCRVVDLTK
jgi:hypothetical protein